MYQPIANQIKNNLNKGIAILPTEQELRKTFKMNVQHFLSLDYRISNPSLISNDEESNTNGDTEVTDDVSNYILGFALVRNVETLPQFSSSNRSVITRFKNKIAETLTISLAHSSMRKNRGHRSVYLNNEGITPTQNTLTSLGVTPSNPDQWILLPFLMSTTIFYNNFRANLGVGLKNQELSNIQNDVQTRISIELDSIRDKINKRLTTPITDDLFGKILLVSPKDVMTEKYGVDIFEYVNKKIINPGKKSLVDNIHDDDIIPIPTLLIGNIITSSAE